MKTLNTIITTIILNVIPLSKENTAKLCHFSLCVIIKRNTLFSHVELDFKIYACFISYYYFEQTKHEEQLIPT